MPKSSRTKNSAIIGPSSMMLRTLRIKFIAINMLLAVLVLATAFAAVLYTDYTTRYNAIMSELRSVIATVDMPHVPQIATTQKLTSSSKPPSAISAVGATAGTTVGTAVGTAASTTTGTTNAKGNSVSSTSSTRAAVSSTSSKGTDPDSQTSAPTIGGSDSDNSIILVAVYSVRANGIYTTMSDYTNAKIPEATIIGANESVLNSDSEEGYLPEYNLYYMREASATSSGEYIVAYADGRSMKDWQNLAWVLLFAGIGGLAVLFVLNIFFSKWALKPVVMSVKLQQQFTADASHELKTPLTVILANMAILKSQPESLVEEQMQWVESTHTEAERMQLLVNDMLALSHPDGKTMHIVKENIDFSDLVEGEVLQFESVAFELGIEMNDDIEEGLHVQGNEERLGRMVATLVDNACKYAGAPEDEHLAKVNVKLARKPTSAGAKPKLELTVHNTGPCIPEEDLPYIFQRFYRTDKVRTSSKGGYGLGLAIGQEIVREHDGVITVASNPDDGTVFTVTLPLSE